MATPPSSLCWCVPAGSQLQLVPQLHPCCLPVHLPPPTAWDFVDFLSTAVLDKEGALSLVALHLARKGFEQGRVHFMRRPPNLQLLSCALQTNDDAVTVVSQPIILNITERHSNKNGCKMPAT